MRVSQRLRDPKNKHCVQVCFSSAECFDSSAFKSKLPPKKNFKDTQNNNLHVGPIGPTFLDLRSKRSKLENLQLKVQIVKDFIMVGVQVLTQGGSIPWQHLSYLTCQMSNT